MKHTSVLPVTPPKLAAYLVDNPPSGDGPKDWKAFQHNDPDSYKELIDALDQYQRGLCAYCESRLFVSVLSIPNREVEHWIPKSLSNPDRDYALDVGNFHAACLGTPRASYLQARTNQKHRAEIERYYGNPPPGDNRSCGAFKGKSSPDASLEKPYRPTDIPRDHGVFGVKDNGELYPDDDACRNLGLDPARLMKTIEMLNLNCTRLCNAREAIYKSLSEEFGGLAESMGDDRVALDVMAAEWLIINDQKLPEFFSTFRSFLGASAVSHLATLKDWDADRNLAF